MIGVRGLMNYLSNEQAHMNKIMNINACSFEK